MNHFTKPALQTASGNPENQDRAAIIDSTVGLVLVIADGAGGVSGGAEAATMAVEFVRNNANELRDSYSCIHLLEQMDQAIAEDHVVGQTTCALAVITSTSVYGASVGDSGVWAIDDTDFTGLTRAQVRKPLIGTGSALPIPFVRQRTRPERLLLATDGLLKYATPDRIAATCRSPDSSAATRQLIELVRYPSGSLPDDVTVILASLLPNRNLGFAPSRELRPFSAPSCPPAKASATAGPSC